MSKASSVIIIVNGEADLDNTLDGNNDAVVDAGNISE